MFQIQDLVKWNIKHIQTRFKTDDFIKKPCNLIWKHFFFLILNNLNI